MANQHEGVVEESAFSYKTDEDRKQDQGACGFGS